MTEDEFDYAVPNWQELEEIHLGERLRLDVDEDGDLVLRLSHDWRDNALSDLAAFCAERGLVLEERERHTTAGLIELILAVGTATAMNRGLIVDVLKMWLSRRDQQLRVLEVDGRRYAQKGGKFLKAEELARQVEALEPSRRADEDDEDDAGDEADGTP